MAANLGASAISTDQYKNLIYRLHRRRRVRSPKKTSVSPEAQAAAQRLIKEKMHLIKVETNNGGEDGIRTHDTALGRITV